MRQTLLLIILDGWGLGQKNESNPVHVVNPQSFRWLEENFPVTSLQASGIGVGLPWGEVGNSEVGHLTIGAGKVVYQYFPRITLSIKDGSFFENQALKQAFTHAKENNSSVNLVGILTEGTVHASLDHLLALLEMGALEGVASVKLHLFGDGKDGTPFRLEKILEKIPGDKLATLMGRYYGMDREKNWQLTEKAYAALVGEAGERTDDPLPTIKATYEGGYSEEFLPPLRLKDDSGIKENDSIIFFNFREDSIRQIAESFILKDFKDFPTKNFKNVYVATMTKYEDRFGAPVAFPPINVNWPLGKVLSAAGKNQLRLAESYKYAHVTYFFNGYIEEPFAEEYRVFIPSIKTPKADESPEMMAKAITDRIIQAIENQAFDFILANYANPDTIAHTGNYQAAVEAVKVIDVEIGRILKMGLNNQTTIIITSDHGNIEELTNPITGIPESQHDASPVPFYLIGPKFAKRKFQNWQNLEGESVGSLADVAPTVLELMGIPQPEEMTGVSLIKQLL